MKTSGSTVFFALVFLATAVAFAGDEVEPPKPTAEHEELGTWVGSWAGKGDMKSGPFGPGGPMTWTEECSWFAGGKFHVICKSKGSGPMGETKGLGIMGYNAEKGVYTHYGVDSRGWAGHSEGTRSGDSYTFKSEETMGGKTFHSRFTLTMESPARMRFNWEMSEDGTTWMSLMEGVSEKK